MGVTSYFFLKVIKLDPLKQFENGCPDQFEHQQYTVTLKKKRGQNIS